VGHLHARIFVQLTGSPVARADSPAARCRGQPDPARTLPPRCAGAVDRCGVRHANPPDARSRCSPMRPRAAESRCLCPRRPVRRRPTHRNDNCRPPTNATTWTARGVHGDHSGDTSSDGVTMAQRPPRRSYLTIIYFVRAVRVNAANLTSTAESCISTPGRGSAGFNPGAHHGGPAGIG